MDLLEEPFNVVPKGKDHDAHKENEANLLGEFSLPFSKGASEDSLEGKEQKMTTVEDWDREQIQDTQIDAKDGTRNATLEAPRSAASPEMLAIMIGPPRFLLEISPVINL